MKAFKYFLGIILIIVAIVLIVGLPLIAVRTEQISIFGGLIGIIPLLIGCYLIQTNSTDVD